MNQLSRRRNGLRNDGIEWTADLLQCVRDVYQRLPPSLVSLCRLQRVVWTLGARNGLVWRSSRTIESIDAHQMRSAVAMRSVWLLGVDAPRAEPAVHVPVDCLLVACALVCTDSVCTPASSKHSSIT